MCKLHLSSVVVVVIVAGFGSLPCDVDVGESIDEEMNWMGGYVCHCNSGVLHHS
jgi:hypothetical protein